MSKRLLVLVLFAFSCIAAQQEKISDSKVTEVTVFTNKALITRGATLNLPAGKNQIIISNLPVDLKNESVRVSAAGPGIVKILDVSVERKFTSEFRQEKIKYLQSKIDSLKNIDYTANDKISVLNSKKEFVESLKAEALKYANERILLNSNSTKTWGEMLHFVESNLSEIYSGIREQNQKRNNIQTDIRKLEQEINLVGSGKSKDYKDVIIKIDNSKGGKVTLNPSYIVDGAGWYPVYDARVNSKSKEIELDYFGMIRQSTGEEWENVKLVLSTAEPLMIKSIPSLNRWYLDTKPSYSWRRDSPTNVSNSIYEINYENNNGLPARTGVLTGYIIDASTREPLIGANVLLAGTNIGAASDQDGKFYIGNVPSGNYNLKTSYVGYQAITIAVNVKEKQTAILVLPLNQQNIEGQEIVVMAAKPGISKSVMSAQRTVSGDEVKIHYADVNTKQLSTTFEIPTAYSIPSDNNPHKVTIAADLLPVKFEYTSIPKADQKVFLKGKIINTKDYPLLNGEINVFVDNDFINRTSLNTVVPTDTLELALGIDEKIKVERIRINRFVESKGLFGGDRSITYDYEIRLTNNRATEENVLVLDQVPVAMNEEIKITLLEPSKDKAVIKNNQNVEWNVNLKPGEKKTIPFKYVVEFPADIEIYGLE